MISPLLKNELDHLGNQLITLHKQLLDFQTRSAEAQDGRRYGPYELLNLCLNDHRFQWLRELSRLITEIDDCLSKDKEGLKPLDLRRLLNNANNLLNGSVENFVTKYKGAVSADPQLAIQEVEVRKILSGLTPFIEK